MVEFKKEIVNDSLFIFPIGRIDSVTAPMFQEAIAGAEAYNHVVLDLKQLEYISSAGLRVLLLLKKAAEDKDIKLINVNDDVMDVFEMTGFTNILTIEK